MRIGFVAAGMFVLACGTEAKSGKTEVAQRGLNQLVKAIMSQDPELIRARLSSKEIASAERLATRPGETVNSVLLKQYDSQRRGLIMNFGEEWLAKNSIEVAEVKALGENFYAVSIVLNGEVFSDKPVYFAEENGEFKFAGINNPTSVAVYAAAVDIQWNHWKFRSGTDVCETVYMNCGVDGTWTNVSWRGPPNSTIWEINPANCWSYEYWYGAKHTAVGFAGQTQHAPNSCSGVTVPDPGATYGNRNWAGPYPGFCMYNAIGLDAFTDAYAVFHCTPP